MAKGCSGAEVVGEEGSESKGDEMRGAGSVILKRGVVIALASHDR